MVRTRNFVLAFAIGTAVALAGSWWLIGREHTRALAEWRTWLSGTVDNRARLVGLWLAERAADCRMTAFRRSVRAALQTPGGDATLGADFDSIAAGYGYDAVVLVDRAGRVVAAGGHDRDAWPGAGLHELARRVIAGDTATFAVISDPGDTTMLVFAAPVESPRGPPKGAVVMLISPQERLFPIVLRETGRTRAAETILAQVRGDTAFLVAATWPTPRTGPQPTLRLDTAGQARRRLFQRRSTFERYIDYNGADMLSSAAPVPGTDWVLVLKVPAAEALAPFRRSELLMLLALGLAVAAWGLWLRVLMRRAEAQQRETIAAIAASERRFRDMMETVELLTHIIDRDGKIVFVNDALLRLVGRTREEMIGQDSVAALLPPEYREGANRLVRGALEAGTAVTTFDTKLLTRDGRDVRVHWNSTILRDAAGQVEGIASIGEDVTVLRKVEDDLRQSEERYRALVEGARDVIFVLDPDGRLAWLNPAFEDMTGFAREEWLGRPFEELVAEEDRAQARLVFGRVLSLNPQRPTAELHLRTRDGITRLGEFTGTPQIKHNKVVGILGVCRDITERATLEQQLRQSSRMEAVGQLAGGIAHDFNNLLTVIIGSSELLLADIPEDNPMHGDLAEIRASAGRAAMLTRQLLAFSRRQMLAPRHIDLNSIVTGAASMLRRLIGEHIALDVRLGSGLGTVRADPSQLEQVIVNLAVNARDAMPRGGTLTIGTAELRNDEPVAIGSAQMPRGHWCVLEIRDTGGGMTPEVLSHVFEPFFTTKPPGQGTGLGLASAYGVIKQSDGFIAVDSAPGTGTAFRIYLPRTAGEREGIEPRAAAPAPPGSETILIAEDEATVRAIATQVLQRQGYRVLQAGSGTEALALMAGGGAHVDLLLSDVVMPGMSGPELAERLAKRHAAMKVMFMSGYADDAVESRGALGRGARLLIKPFTPDELARRVREVLDGGG